MASFQNWLIASNPLKSICSYFVFRTFCNCTTKFWSKVLIHPQTAKFTKSSPHTHFAHISNLSNFNFNFVGFSFILTPPIPSEKELKTFSSASPATVLHQMEATLVDSWYPWGQTNEVNINCRSMTNADFEQISGIFAGEYMMESNDLLTDWQDQMLTLDGCYLSRQLLPLRSDKWGEYQLPITV